MSRTVAGQPSTLNLPALRTALAVVNATRNELTTTLATKQDAGDYATRDDVREGLDAKQPAGHYPTAAELAEALEAKQGVGDYATVHELQSGLATKQPKGDYAFRSAVAEELATRDRVIDNVHHDIDELSGNLTGRVSSLEVLHEDLLKEVQAMDGSLEQVGDDVDTYSSALMAVNHDFDTYRTEAKKRLTLLENNVEALLARAGEDEEFAASLEERLNTKRKRIEALETGQMAANVRASHLEKRAATCETGLADHTLKLLNLHGETAALRTWAVADEARIQDNTSAIKTLSDRVTRLEEQVNKTAVKK